MLSTLGIVQVDLPSKGHRNSRQLESLATRRFGGKTLLEWIVRRVTDSQKLDGVIVLLNQAGDDRQFQNYVPADVPVFVSKEPDPLAQFADVIEEYPTEAIVRVRLDRPFVDPVMIDRLVISASRQQTVDYVGYCSSRGVPAVNSNMGVFAEWCRTKAIKQAHRQATAEIDRNDVTRFLYSHPEWFQLRLLPAPAQLDREDVRLTIDGEDDWEHAQTIFDALGPERLDWQRIASLLDQHPALRRQMALLNQADSCSK